MLVGRLSLMSVGTALGFISAVMVSTGAVSREGLYKLLTLSHGGVSSVCLSRQVLAGGGLVYRGQAA